MSTYTIALTGGGTAGHVTPNLALIPTLKELDFSIHYIGTESGIERTLAEEKGGLPYYPVRSGKLRRYFSFKNLTDPLRVIGGIRDAKKALEKIKPDLVFSKGGFVSVPVVMAARQLKIPVILHESDCTPGLANRLCARYATKLLVTFPAALEHLPNAVCTGTPIRESLLCGDGARGLSRLGFDGGKPVLLCAGGSQGAQAINEMLRECLDDLLPQFDIVHLCGKGKKEDSLTRPGYVQLEYAEEDLADILACASIAVARAGANSVLEYAALHIPALLIPLPLSQSRGDQIQNADCMRRQGYAEVLPQEQMTRESFTTAIRALERDRERYVENMECAERSGTPAVIEQIMAVIKDANDR